MIVQPSFRYKILQKIGDGGMSEVFLAYDNKLDRRVALKFLKSKIAEDMAFRSRFFREARVAAAVDHPYVCKIYEVEELEGKTCLVLEYVEGETLQSSIGKGRLPVEEVLKIAREIAEAIAEAHLKNIVHRDIKPGNIMLTPRHHVKVMDFGLAKQFESSRDQSVLQQDVSTQSNAVIGTPPYMSPEQLRGEHTDSRSDIFSFGIVLYEMLSGAHPFCKPTVQAMTAAILYEKHKPLREVVPGISEAFDSIFDRMLAKQPELRFNSMQNVWSELGDLQRGLSPQRLEKSAAFAVAVLPFTDLSEGKQEEYFCDGLVEELISVLTQVEGMRVVSRTSVFRFKGHNEDVRKIAAELNVKALVEGSVRKIDQRLRITIKLVSGDTGYPLWSEQFESELAGIFEIQDAISRSIAEKLKTTVTPLKKKVRAAGTTIEAYDQYLRGIYCWNKRTEEGLKQGIEYFRNALSFDSHYLPALTSLADTLATMALYGAVAPTGVIPEARDAADKALALDPESAAALTTRACLQAIYDWDWAGAERNFQTAMSYDVRYALAHHWYANHLLIPLARFDEARIRVRAALELEPFSPPIAVSQGIISLFERRYMRAIDELRQTLRAEPSFGMAHYFFGQAHVQTGNYREALVALSFAKTLTGGSPEVISVLGYTHALAGNVSEARRCLAELLHLSNGRYVSPVLMAQVCVALRQFNDAFSYLQLAYEVRSADLIWLRVRPAFDTICDDARFSQLCSKLRLPPSDSPAVNVPVSG